MGSYPLVFSWSRLNVDYCSSQDSPSFQIKRVNELHWAIISLIGFFWVGPFVEKPSFFVDTVYLHDNLSKSFLE
jgi:hypothetical protein